MFRPWKTPSAKYIIRSSRCRSGRLSQLGPTREKNLQLFFSGLIDKDLSLTLKIRTARCYVFPHSFMALRYRLLIIISLQTSCMHLKCRSTAEYSQFPRWNMSSITKWWQRISKEQDIVMRKRKLKYLGPPMRNLRHRILQLILQSKKRFR